MTTHNFPPQPAKGQLRRFQQRFTQPWPDAWLAIRDYINTHLMAQGDWQQLCLRIDFAPDQVSVAQLKDHAEEIKRTISPIPRCQSRCQFIAKDQGAMAHMVTLEFIEYA